MNKVDRLLESCFSYSQVKKAYEDDAPAAPSGDSVGGNASVNDLGTIPNGNPLRKSIKDKDDNREESMSRAGELLKKYKRITEARAQLKFDPIITRGQAAQLAAELKSAGMGDDFVSIAQGALIISDSGKLADVKSVVDKLGFKYSEETLEDYGMDIDMNGTPDAVTKVPSDPNLSPDEPAATPDEVPAEADIKDDVVKALGDAGFNVEPIEGGVQVEKDAKSCVIKWG